MLIPVISLYPPWANWVALGWKTIETRLHDRFKSLVGKRIGIHVGLKWDESAFRAASFFLDAQRMAISREFLRVGGAIICTARVRGVDWLTAKDSQAALIDCHSERRFGLFLANVHVIPAIACRGKQGIWYYDLPEGTDEV